MTTAPLLALEDIHFRYPGAAEPVLRGLNFSLAPGERVGIVGPNGCGKTTFFSIVMGLARPERGRVVYEGRTMENEKDFRLLRQGVGLVFQHPDDQLFSPTVLEDVAFGPLNLGLSQEEARQRAMETLASLGLSGFENRLTHRLSGGEKRLAALATVLAMRPRALLLDEPTNDLDQQVRGRLIDVLAGLKISLVVVSHDWDFLDATTNRLEALRDGHLERDPSAAPHRHLHVHSHGQVPHQHLDKDLANGAASTVDNQQQPSSKDPTRTPS